VPEQAIDGGLTVLDCGALVVGEWDLNEHPLEVRLCLEQLDLRGVLWQVEVAPSTGHPVAALLEEIVGAVAVTEVEVLPGLALSRSAGTDRLAIDENLDRSDVACEVTGVIIGLGQLDRADSDLVLS
jgi:hypothetical protein